jgi:hypothetical protein
MLYRDIIFKSIYSSFDFNLLFYFLYSNLYYFDKMRFNYILKLNNDNIYLINYLLKQPKGYYSDFFD